MAAAHVAGVLLLTLLGAYAVPRGVDPANAAFYEGKGGTFTCLDGSKTIPISQVNDNYCDCPSDGTDEPGTSACYWGRFYCANRGHQPQLLSASFVDDGICDCCDGTDEPVGCKNTCLDKGAAERQTVRDKAEQMKRSLETKQQLISDGIKRRAGWATRAPTIDTEIVQQEKEVTRIEDEKKSAQTAADEDRQRLQQEEDERQRQQAEAQAKEQAAAQQEAPQAGDAGADGAAPDSMETDEERGRRIASQWTSDPDAAGVPTEDHEEVIEGEVDDGSSPEHEEYGEGDDVGDDDDDTDDDDAGQASKSGGVKPVHDITFMEFLQMQWNETKASWTRELEDFSLFIHVLKTFYRQVHDSFRIIMKGGMRELQLHNARVAEERRNIQQKQTQAKIEKELSSLYAPWRDPEWQEAAMMMQKQRELAAARGEEWVPTEEQKNIIEKASRRAEEMAALDEAKQKAAEEGGDKVADKEVAEKHKKEVKKKRKPKSTSGVKPRKAVPKPASAATPAAGHDYAPTPPGAYSSHTPPHHHQHIYSPLDSKVYQLNTELDQAKRKLDELKDEKQVIQRYHSSGIRFDYGPGDTFLPLAGRCISDVGTRWTYEACFFDLAIQKEPHNPNNKVSLGSFRGWDENYSVAVFDNGDPCAGAPNRSLRVKLVCGDSERMYGGEEPSTCLYTVTLTTPLACKQSDLDQEHAKLAELERFESEIRAEIEAAEKARQQASAHSEL